MENGMLQNCNVFGKEMYKEDHFFPSLLIAVSYMWNLKKDTNALICRTEADLQIWKNLGLSTGTDWWEWPGGLRLALALCFKWNDWPKGSSYIAQRTLPNIL